MTTPEVQSSGRYRSRLASPAAAVFLVSAAILGLQLSLMRCFAVAAWYHFSYLVISTALLGFGASGTFLTLVGRALERRFAQWAAALTLAFGLSVTLSFRAAQALPLDPQYVLYSARQAALMAAHHMLFLIPFFLGATVIGLSLMHFRQRVHALYGASMLGSGAGSLLMILLMYVLPEARLLYAVSALALAAAGVWAAHIGRSNSQREAAPCRESDIPLQVWRVRTALAAAIAASAALLAVGESVWPLQPRIDQYKMLSALRRWEAEGGARHLLSRHSPRARLDVYESPRFHYTLFASLTTTLTPPNQLMILADGNPAGAVLRINRPEEAAILDHTPMSLPYRLRDRPRVLLLGETGGMNVWLAQRWDAPGVTVVQRNPQVIELLGGPLASMGGRVLSLPGVTAAAADPRLFLETTRERYDIIQIVQAEEMPAGAAGMLSLHEDFLLTREGLALCLRRLRPNGLLAITRGIQWPPRDNVKVLATVTEALESLGKAPASRHMVQARSYLAATTLASPSPLSGEDCPRFLAACKELGLDVEWAPCSGVNYADQIHRVPGPPGEGYSYYHHAALEIFSHRREEFFRTWAYNVRPATDDSPYFFNFFRWKSLPMLMKAYGGDWFRRLELGYIVVVAALLEVVLAGSVLIVLPLAWMRRVSPRPVGRLPVITYFLALGGGYMLVEMVLILKFTKFLGDPILAAGGILSAFLLFSGLGSALSGRLVRRPSRAIGLAALCIGGGAIAYALLLDHAFRLAASWPTPARFALSAVIVAPLAFAMGWPFPNGLACLERAAPALTPWAWAANGFASVAGAPAAVLLAVECGFGSVLAAGAVLYACAGLLAPHLPGARGAADA